MERKTPRHFPAICERCGNHDSRWERTHPSAQTLPANGGIQSDVRFIGVDNTIEIWAKEKTEQPFVSPEEFSEALQDILGDEDDWEEEEDE